MANTFYISAINDPVPRAFDPHDPDAAQGDADLRYFIGVAAALDRQVGDRALTVLITWHLDSFEDRFEDAVVLLINDEMYQTPSFAGRVQAIFKTGGVIPNPWSATLRLHPAISWRATLRQARNIARAQQRRRATPQTRGAPMHQLPLGYLRLIDVPVVPFSERHVDVYFAGSIESTDGFTVRPRLVARRQMAAALLAAQERRPDLRVDLSAGGPMANPAAMVDGQAYSERLMGARIALCPRGNFDETFRLMEAARSGCVIVTEALPERWYYRDAPVVQLARWSDLPDALDALLADEDALAERAARTGRWWEASLCEDAVARYIARHLPSARVAGR